MRIITDFDGPIMDLSDRYYHVYQLCLAEFNIALDVDPSSKNKETKVLTKADFWDLKRARTPEQEIAILSGVKPDRADDFKQWRDLHAHRLEYLDLDRVVPDAIESLAKIQKEAIDLCVMTLRRTKELNPALEQYDLGQFFHPSRRYCLGDDYTKQGDIHDKTQLMAQALAELPADDQTWMIGDTEADIIAAKTHHIPVIGVLSGIRDRDRLARYQPDRIVPNLQAAVEFLGLGG
jgi:phosphoglycolate phosphatase-like HAD superfamily hydrolase